MEPTVVTGRGPDGIEYRAEFNGEGGPVLITPAVLWTYTPETGDLILSGPVGLEFEFDPENPVAVYAWLHGNTSVLAVEGPRLLPDIPGDLIDVPEPTEPAAESVEEADPNPKGREWPGWERDQATAEHWASELLTELVDAFDPERIAARWLRSDVVRAAAEASPEEVPAEAPAEPVPPPVPAAAAAEWLLGQGVAIQAALVATIPAAITDGYLIGAKAAEAVIDGLGVDWDDWEPGDEDAAAKILGADGRGQGLQELLDESEVRLYEISAARMEAFATLLAKAVAEGWSVDQLAKELLAFRNDRTWAYLTAQTEIARAISAATLDTYVENDIERHEWSISGPDPQDRVRVCPICQKNAAAGPVEVGKPFPSGEKHPPGHPRCRCALIPVIDFDETTAAQPWMELLAEETAESVEEARYVRTAAGAAKYGDPIGSPIKPNPRKSSAGAAAIARATGVRVTGGAGEHSTSTDADRVRRKTLLNAAARADRVRPYDADPGSHIAAALQRAIAGRKPVYIHSAGSRTTISLQAPELGNAQFLVRPNGTVWRRSMTREGEERLQQVPDDRVTALVAPHIGLGGQPIPRPAINLRAAVRNPKALDDMDLEEAMQAAITGDNLSAFDKLAAESDRRDAARQARQRRSDEAERRKAEEYERLITRGYAEEEAVAAAYGVSVEKQRRAAALTALRGKGYQGRSLEEAARAAFRDEVYEHYLRAELELGTSMLTKKAQAAGVDERSLFVGSEARARKHASDELKGWWDEHGRPTFDEFLAQLLDDPYSAARSRNSRSDFLQ